MLAKAIASNIDSTFMTVVSSALLSKYLGDSSLLVREMFRYARDHQVSSLFFFGFCFITCCDLHVFQMIKLKAVFFLWFLKPCIIFMEEIDAIGRRRGSSEGEVKTGECDRVLIELLSQLDGFNELDKVSSCIFVVVKSAAKNSL